MCGLVAMIGLQKQDVLRDLLKGLERVEYRGYDGVGMAWRNSPDIVVEKSRERLPVFAEGIISQGFKSSMAIGHTRWPSQGSRETVNAHPHFSFNEKIAVVHNGDFHESVQHNLRRNLEAEGIVFKSETDTEVLAHLIALLLQEDASRGLADAVEEALLQLKGAYAIAVMSKEHPDEIVIANKNQSLLIGIGENRLMAASDEPSLAGFVDECIPLENGSIAVLRADGSLDLSRAQGDRRKLSVREEETNKGLFGTFTEKEIHEQPHAMRELLRDRLHRETGAVTLGLGESAVEALTKQSARITIVACGTSLHAALIGKLLIESIARVSVEVECASEFAMRDPVISSGHIVIGISQSGETADTVTALRNAKDRGAFVIAIGNKTGTQIPRMADATVYVRAGVENAVASTKAFTSQVGALVLFAVSIARLRNMESVPRVHRILSALAAMPETFERILEVEEQVRELASRYGEAKRTLFVGRGFAYPVALEGALKLKEIAYVDAEGYPAGELKHGPLALVEEGVPVFAVALRDEWQEAVIGNIKQISGRGGEVIAISTEGDRRLNGLVKHTIEVPEVPTELSALVSIIPLQLYALHVGLLRGVDVDKPRNLAKSVTVE